MQPEQALLGSGRRVRLPAGCDVCAKLVGRGRHTGPLVFTAQQRNHDASPALSGFDAFFGDTSLTCPVHPGRSGKWAVQRMPRLSSFVVIHSLYRPILSRGTGKTLQGPRTIAYDPGLPDNSPLLDDSLGRSYLVGK